MSVTQPNYNLVDTMRRWLDEGSADDLDQLKWARRLHPKKFFASLDWGWTTEGKNGTDGVERDKILSVT